MSGLQKKALHGLMWTFGQQFGFQFINFFVSVILARLLLPAEFGLIGIVAIFMAIGKSLVDSGMTSSLIRTTEPDQLDYSTVFFAHIANSLLIYLIIYLAAPSIAHFFGHDELKNLVRVYCLTFIINALIGVQSTKLNKEMKFKTQLMINIPSLLTGSAVGVAMAYAGFGVWSLIWMNLTQSVVAAVQLWVRSGWSPSLKFDKTRLKTHLGFGYKLTLSGLLTTLINNIYRVVIAKLFSPAQLGFFTRAKSMQELPVTNISSALNKVTYPMFASIKEDKVKLRVVFRRLIRLVFFVIAPVMVISIVIAEPLFRLLLTAKWLPAVPYFQILCLAGIFMPMNSYNLNILLVNGRSDQFLKLEVVKNVLIVAGVALVIPFGIYGLLWSMVLAAGITFFLNAHYAGREIDLQVLQQMRDMAPPLILSFVCGAAAYFTDMFVRNVIPSDIIRIVAASGIAFAIYLILAALFKLAAFHEIKAMLLKRNSSLT